MLCRPAVIGSRGIGIEEDRVRRFAAECVSTLVLVVVACRVLGSGSDFAPLAIGATAALLVVIQPDAPGLGPAVAAASWIRGMLSTGQLLATVTGQLSGAGLGALLSRLAPGPFDVGPLPPGSVVALLVECIGVGILVHVVLRARTDRWILAIPVGATVTMLCVVAAGLSASLFNPSLLIGAVAMGWLTPAGALGYAAAHLCGALVGAWTAAPFPLTRPPRTIGRPAAHTSSVPVPRAAGDLVGEHRRL